MIIMIIMMIDFHDSDNDDESVDTWGGGVEKLTLWFSILRGNVQKVHFAPEIIKGLWIIVDFFQQNVTVKSVI